MNCFNLQNNLLFSEIQSNKELLKIFQLLPESRLVGGCVRDFLLYNKLVYDIDIATCYLPNIVIDKLSPYFTVIPTGLKHGTVTVIGRHKYEITTLRTDDQTDGRHAQVSFSTSWEADSKRRDFTINALYADINGKIYDYHGGLNDLNSQIVKFIGSPIARIQEDYLRIMRFFRFVARFGNYDEAGLEGCFALKDNLLKISKERITQEWFKIIEGKYFWKILPELQLILDVIGMNNYNGNQIALSVLGLTSAFMTDNSLIVLSNKQKQYIKNLQKLKMHDRIDALMLALKYGEEFVKDKMILENKQFDLSLLSELKNLRFPITGNDLLQLGYSGKQIGEELKHRYRDWIKSRR